MFVIGEVVVEDQIVHERFACNLSECKGACCTLPGGRGAPLEESEVEELQRAYPAARQFLSERHRNYIDEFGMFEDISGTIATTCIDNRDCVFVYYENEVARCAIEQAYH